MVVAISQYPSSHMFNFLHSTNFLTSIHSTQIKARTLRARKKKKQKSDDQQNKQDRKQTRQF